MKARERSIRKEVTVRDYMKAGAVVPRAVVRIPTDPNSKKVALGVVKKRGRAMFAARSIVKGELIERAPVIVLPGKQWKSIEDTSLIDYAFDWGEGGKEAVIALGYISIYNHSYSPNAVLNELDEELMMEIIALADIRQGEEVTINYNGEPGNNDPLWFTEP